jgi:hypothetical protein
MIYREFLTLESPNTRIPARHAAAPAAAHAADVTWNSLLARVSDLMTCDHDLDHEADSTQLLKQPAC